MHKLFDHKEKFPKETFVTNNPEAQRVDEDAAMRGAAHYLR